MVTYQPNVPIIQSGPAQGKVMINIVPIDCSKIEDVGKRDICYLDALISTKNATICDKLSDFSLLIKCYSDVAAATKNPNVCVKLTTDSWRDDCYYAAAKAKEDPVICGSLIYPEKRKLCYAQFDLSKFKELDVCPKLWTAEQKIECHDIFT